MKVRQKPRAISLKKAFTLSAVFAAGGLAGCGDSPTGPNAPSFPLTEGEIAFAHTLFNDEIRPGPVRKYKEKAHPHMAAAVWNYATIVIYGDQFWSDDYSKEENSFKFGTFAHELTHIWQHNTGRRYTNGFCRIYHYSLYEDSDFTEFCNEQQASIIEDYALRFLMLRPGASHRFENRNGPDTPETDRLLWQIVERRFPWLESTRKDIASKREFMGLSSKPHPLLTPRPPTLDYKHH